MKTEHDISFVISKGKTLCHPGFLFSFYCIGEPRWFARGAIELIDLGFSHVLGEFFASLLLVDSSQLMVFFVIPDRRLN